MNIVMDCFKILTIILESGMGYGGGGGWLGMRRKGEGAGVGDLLDLSLKEWEDRAIPRSLGPQSLPSWETRISCDAPKSADAISMKEKQLWTP